tara:strand:+ start:240 stop:752 length:513 start_codon:yes stop_codon:yes gene_type:complete
MATGLVCKVKPCGGTIMSEFDGIENTGVKAMRETIDRKNEEIAKLQSELHEHKDAKLNSVVKQIGLNPSSGFGKALKQVYDGDATVEAVSEFAKTEYSYEPTGGLQEITQAEVPPVVQDDARARVASLDANSTSDVPGDVLSELQDIISKGTTKDSIRARLTLMENEKNN